MMIQKSEKQRKLPGISATLAAGFDLTTKHLWLTLIPILLDTFFWLGPRLSMQLLIDQVIAQLQALMPPDAISATMAEQWTAMLTQWSTLAAHTNLFTSLSVPLVGVPTLLVGLTPERTPLQPDVLQLNSFVTWLGLFVLFSLVGLLLTAVYLTLIAQATASGEQAASVPQIFLRIGHVWGYLFALGIAAFIALVILYIPLSLVTFLVSLLSPVLGVVVMFAGLVVIMWVVLIGYFVPQGLALHGRSPIRAFIESAQLLRAHAQTAMGMILAVIFLSRIMNQLLFLLDDGTWMNFVSILAHAFISTSFVAATFIFYRDRIQHTLLEIDERLETS